MPLNLHTKKDAGDRAAILFDVLGSGGTATDFINRARAEGLGYRAKEMYQDYRLAKAEAQGQTPREPVIRAPDLAAKGYDPRPSLRAELPQAPGLEARRPPKVQPDIKGKAGKDYYIGNETQADQRRYEILRDYVNSTKPQDQKGAEYIRLLKAEGLTYNRQKMYDDLHRAQAVEHASTPAKREAANKFYNDVWTKTRDLLKSKGLPHSKKDVNEAIKNWKLASSKISQDVEDTIGAYYWSMYS